MRVTRGGLNVYSLRPLLTRCFVELAEFELMILMANEYEIDGEKNQVKPSVRTHKDRFYT